MDQNRVCRKYYEHSEQFCAESKPNYETYNYYAPSGAPKKSISFLSSRDLFSYRTIPALGLCAYLGTAVGTVAHRETFTRWLGSEYGAVKVINGLTLTSIVGAACYIYGRRHIRHAGAFQKVLLPTFASLCFNCGSHFNWALIKEIMKEQDCFDYHWRIAAALLSGLLFVSLGRGYLSFIDHW